MEKSYRFIQMDEEGYLMVDDLRVADLEIGNKTIAHIQMDERNRPFTFFGDEPAIIEAFDEPYVALSVEKIGGKMGGKNSEGEGEKTLATGTDGSRWTLLLPYQHREEFEMSSLTVDEWDRFHGHSVRGVPFVLSRAAQAELFNLVDDYDDESITVGGIQYTIQPWLTENPEVNRAEWWSDLYATQQSGWDLEAPSHVLASRMPQLKLQKSRVLVPCCGSGNDAAWFAEQGHLVTAVDFSIEAIERGRKKYGHLSNLKFLKANIFDLPIEMTHSFDLIFEHTCYCAIDPRKRKDLVQLWRRLLVDNGHVMGVFFAMDKSFGPPYGGSEWEMRQRLQKGQFRLLYWNRLRDSKTERMGKELFVYAQKIPNFSSLA